MSVTLQTTDPVDFGALCDQTGWEGVRRDRADGVTELQILTPGVRVRDVEAALAEHLTIRDAEQRARDEAVVERVERIETAALDELRDYVLARERERLRYEEARSRLDASEPGDTDGGRG